MGGWFSQIGDMHQVHHLWGECAKTMALLNWYTFEMVISLLQLIKTSKIDRKHDKQLGSFQAGMNVWSKQVY